MNWKILVVGFMATLVYGDIGGVVYKDLPFNGKEINSYGVKNKNERGVQGVTVTIHLQDGTESTVTTDDSGVWKYTTEESKLRVEFSHWSDYLMESIKGTADKNSAIRFVNNGDTNITFGLYDVNSYFTTSNPSYLTTIISNGNTTDSNVSALVFNNYTDSRFNSDFKDAYGNQGNGNRYQVEANASDIGTVWGAGYQASKKRVWLASSMWRHVGTYENKLGLIFTVDYRDNKKVIKHFDLQGVNGIDVGSVIRTGSDDYTLSTPLEPNVDFDAYAKGGKISFGDLDYDEKTQTLWVVNLHQKGIIRMDASSNDLSSVSSSAKQYLLKDLNGVPQCTGGELRPWALSIHNGKGYIGMVCDASTSQKENDLKAYLSSFDLEHPENGLTSELTIAMDYDRKTNADGIQGKEHFMPWTDVIHDTIKYEKGYFWDYYDQPLFSDIEFDESGNAYLAFTDRYSLQIGVRNYSPIKTYKHLKENIVAHGEIFKVCNINGKLELEGTDGCSVEVARNGDFDFFDDKGGDSNANSAGGALAILPGSKQLLATINDPHPSGSYGKKYWSSSGVETFSLTDGSIDNWYTHHFGIDRPYRGKGVGLGDIEFLNEAAPIEIGDRVWLDSNGNGRQDIYEKGIENVTLELIKENKLIASVVTNSEGDYLFSNHQNSDSSNRKYNISELLADGANYFIRLPNVISSGEAEDNLSLTIASSGEGSTALLHDSDAENKGTLAEVAIYPKVGENLHSIDIGFRPQILIEANSNIAAQLNSNGEDNDCNCSSYNTDSVAIFDNKMLIISILLLNLILFFFYRNELDETV